MSSEDWSASMAASMEDRGGLPVSGRVMKSGRGDGGCEDWGTWTGEGWRGGDEKRKKSSGASFSEKELEEVGERLMIVLSGLLRVVPREPKVVPDVLTLVRKDWEGVTWSLEEEELEGD